MKQIIRNVFLYMLLAMVTVACEEDAALIEPNVVHNKSTLTSETVAETAFLRSVSEPGNEFIFRDLVEQTGDELYVELAKPTERDMTFTIGIDATFNSDDLRNVTKKYYNIFVANLIEDWEDHFTITNGGKVKVTAGEQRSTRVSFVLSKMSIPWALMYLLPLVAMDEDGVQHKLFYHITEQEIERQDRSKKLCTIVAYINTEMMNPLIADQYTVKLDYRRSIRDRDVICENTPVVDIVNVRKALLAYDVSSQRALLKYTQDMEYILKNNDQYIQPLRRNGIKVCLSIEGGGTGVGFANLTDSQIADFVAQVKVAVQMYRLDGIHLRDEGAGYDKAEAPAVNETSYPKLIKALREAMPGIMLTLADDGGTTAMMDKAQDGIVVGDYIDLAWNVVWDSVVNPWANDSERKPIVGMTKERYGGFAFYIKPRTGEEPEELSLMREKALAMVLDEGVGKIAVVENIPYRDYNQEVLNTDSFSGLFYCFYRTLGPYPKYGAAITESFPTSMYYAFRKDW